ncbi:hypothetical protein BOW53_08675 [Solemya pervernicosa gill symbiont]|uniref:Uncharacterized protein n=2 Tax=Gammaproteobacteria incertae sedis TaxID=118884 RepID=A0A1T2L4X8_9GAMM|nr:hypothetical protein [Candidatus Reidiella endopervernicosa]OOZ40168.1 hypothetical protein BOW53_08675 [Solemya pervernicosa gill symbiont]QKQ25102.1 hypothetical protein HUE57_01490 [Candidatus Reidiella endopervernicosa]
MKLDVDTALCKRARLPHELFMLNLALFHLLMTPASIALDVGVWGLLLPLSLSLSVMLYTWLRSRALERSGEPWFLRLHWRLALGRYRMLLIAYGVALGLFGVGTLLSLGSSDPHMQQILQTVFIRIAIMPVLIMVMINFYLESNAINQASGGELPDGLVARYPEANLEESAVG